jgi:hypothetical protein
MEFIVRALVQLLRLCSTGCIQARKEESRAIYGR